MMTLSGKAKSDDRGRPKAAIAHMAAYWHSFRAAVMDNQSCRGTLKFCAHVGGGAFANGGGGSVLKNRPQSGGPMTSISQIVLQLAWAGAGAHH